MSAGYHPQIGSIIRIRDQIYTALYVSNDVNSFLNQCLGLMALLKPEDYGEALEKSIVNELAFLSTTKSASKKMYRKNYRAHVYKGWFRDLNKILWEKKYLENEKYQPFKIEEDKKKFG